MIDFSQRSTKEELLDQPNIKQADLFQNLHELDVINQKLGGHQATLTGLKKLMTDKSKTYKIVDFACGGGDTLRIIKDWSEKNGYNVELMGFDLLKDAILFAKQKSTNSNIQWQVADFQDVLLDDCDIAICALVCHHFYDKQLDDFILKMKNSAKLGVIINDLHRNPIAYFGIWLLTSLFSKSRLVKNDAKLSVLKGFKKKEWQERLTKLSLPSFQIQWIWAFRHLIIIRNER